MYNEELNTLIDAALADGVLTEKEKQVLFKKAQSMGIDLDEFEMVLDAKLVQIQKEEKEKAAKSAPKSTKFGDVRKCPVCGAVIQSYMTKCSECGYEFENIEANGALKELTNLLSKKDSWEWDDIIKAYPIPTTKSNFIEFLTYLHGHATSNSNLSFSKACADKINECILRARVVFSDDAQICKLVAEIEKNNNKNAKGKKIRCWCLLILLAILIILEWFLDWDSGWIISLNIITGLAVGFVAAAFHALGKM